MSDLQWRRSTKGIIGRAGSRLMSQETLRCAKRRNAAPNAWSRYFQSKFRNVCSFNINFAHTFKKVEHTSFDFRKKKFWHQKIYESNGLALSRKLFLQRSHRRNVIKESLVNALILLICTRNKLVQRGEVYLAQSAETAIKSFVGQIASLF